MTYDKQRLEALFDLIETLNETIVDENVVVKIHSAVVTDYEGNTVGDLILYNDHYEFRPA
jgi:hypothetical protein